MDGVSRNQVERRADRHAGVGGIPSERSERSVVGLVFALAFGSACATTPRPAPPATAEWERTALDLRAKNSGYTRRIEELENRIFILEDQLDSRKLQAEQQAPPTLPVARVLRSRPTPRAAAANLPATTVESAHATLEEGAASSETSIVAEQGVDYAGEAAQPGGASLSTGAAGASRPMLRLGAPEPAPEGRLVVFSRSAPDPLKVYRQSLELLRAGQQSPALAGFRRFLDGNPQHDYADNAQYWIGECYYDLRQWKTAEREFRKVVERYPHGNKVPDAMLKLGFTLQILGDEAGGRAVLESLARAFPKHEAARAAIDRLAHPEGEPTPGALTPTLGTIVPSSLSARPGGAGGAPR